MSMSISTPGTVYSLVDPATTMFPGDALITALRKRHLLGPFHGDTASGGGWFRRLVSLFQVQDLDQLASHRHWHYGHSSKEV